MFAVGGGGGYHAVVCDAFIFYLFIDLFIYFCNLKQKTCKIDVSDRVAE